VGVLIPLFLIEAILLMVSNNGHRNSHIDNYHNGWINNGWFTMARLEPPRVNNSQI
jgi:hypothetical protein